MGSRGTQQADRRRTGRRKPADPPWHNQRQWALTLALIGVVIVVIMALYLIQTTTTTTTARQLLSMDAYRQELERDNELLRGEIAELESLPRVMTRAAELGFRPAQEDEIQYVIVEGYRYSRPLTTPTPTPTPTPASAIYEETLAGWLQRQWDALREQFKRWGDG